MGDGKWKTRPGEGMLTDTKTIVKSIFNNTYINKAEPQPDGIKNEK